MANPVSHEPFQAYYRKAFHGKCLAIVKAPKSKENTVFKASSDGLASAEIKLSFK
jgi:beta-galactosidase